LIVVFSTHGEFFFFSFSLTHTPSILSKPYETLILGLDCLLTTVSFSDYPLPLPGLECSFRFVRSQLRSIRLFLVHKRFFFCFHFSWRLILLSYSSQVFAPFLCTVTLFHSHHFRICCLCSFSHAFFFTLFCFLTSLWQFPLLVDFPRASSILFPECASTPLG